MVGQGEQLPALFLAEGNEVSALMSVPQDAAGVDRQEQRETLSLPAWARAASPAQTPPDTRASPRRKAPSSHPVGPSPEPAPSRGHKDRAPTSHLTPTPSPKGFLSIPSQTSLKQNETPEEPMIPYATAIGGAGSPPQRLSRNHSQLVVVVPQPAALARTGLTPAPRPAMPTRLVRAKMNVMYIHSTN